MIEIKIPTPGESITEVELTSWYVADGSLVDKDQEIAEIESDKATLTLVAYEAGKIQILVNEGDTIAVGSVACTIDTQIKSEAKSDSGKSTSKEDDKKKEQEQPDLSQEQEEKAEPTSQKETTSSYDNIKVTPMAKKLMKEKEISVDEIIEGLKRLSTKEVRAAMEVLPKGPTSPLLPATTPKSPRKLDHKKMSSLRRKLSARLVSVKNETAMLTTFNEVDMSQVMQLRKKYQKQFIEKHGIKLGFMSFFTKAVTQAIKHHPMVNSFIDQDEFVTPNYADIGIAVQTPKGLMVPVIRDAEVLSLPAIEKKLMHLATKARDGKISLDEMTGGTFTITNGGVFGSMLSTPILNPPQSAILGMHNIIDRPVAINDKVEIRPMMYIALSYDHRIIDGKDSVGFLVKIKEFIENPHSMLFDVQSPDDLLLEL